MITTTFGMAFVLFLLVILAVINPVLRGYNPIFQLLLQLLLVTMFTNIQAYIKPFSQKMDKPIRYVVYG